MTKFLEQIELIADFLVEKKTFMENFLVQEDLS